MRSGRGVGHVWRRCRSGGSSAIAKQQNDFETMYAVSIKCAGPRPSTGYLAIPKKPGKYPTTVSLHGYGHTYPNKGHVVHPVSGGGDKIAFYFSPHGYELSANRNIMTSFTARFARAARRSVSTRSRTPIPRLPISAVTPIA